MKILNYLLLIITFIVFSCRQSKRTNSAVFNTLNERLNVSIDSLRTLNDSLERSLATKLLNEDKATKQAKRWGVIADTINSRTIGINNYIMECLSEIDQSSKTINTTVFYNNIRKHKNFLININPEITVVVSEEANRFTNFFDSVRNDKHSRFSGYLANLPRDERVIIIKETLYQVYLAQNKILFYCNTKVK